MRCIGIAHVDDARQTLGMRHTLWLYSTFVRGTPRSYGQIMGNSHFYCETLRCPSCDAGQRLANATQDASMRVDGKAQGLQASYTVISGTAMLLLWKHTSNQKALFAPCVCAVPSKMSEGTTQINEKWEQSRETY